MIRLLQFVIAVSFLIVVSAGGQTPEATPKPSQSSAITQAPTFASLLRKTVCFLRMTYLKNGHTESISGTGFFVYYEDRRLGDNAGFGYLVTNRHMAEPHFDEGVSYPVVRLSLRLNLLEPEQGRESEEVTIPLGSQFRWFFPSDNGVDLAVLPLFPDQKRYDFKAIPVTFFATKEVVESRKVSEGDSILFTGYFYQFPGQKKFQSIVREGVLAMMPDEDIETTLHRPGRLYLADVHVFGGNSGSPLFVNIGGVRNSAGSLSLVGGFPYLLLGVISGYYQEDTDFKLTIATTVRGTLEENSGIATVVPADELKALLDSTALQHLRDAEVASKKTKN